MISEDIEKAIALVKSGKINESLPILAGVLKRDPANEKAWLWLSFVVDDDNQRMDCYKKILQINPKNMQILRLFSDLEIKLNKKEQPKSQITKKATNQNKPVDLKKEKSENKGEKKKPTNDNLELTKERNKLIVPEEEVNISEDEKNSSKTNDSDDKPEEQKKRKKYPPQIPDKFAWEHIKTQFRPPEIIVLNPEDNFFSNDKEGINQVSRMETGWYDKSIFVDGINISYNDGPRCLQIEGVDDESGCDYCEYFSPRNCLLKFDEFLVDDITRFNAIRAERAAEFARRGEAIINVIHNELKAHGRPLHYSIIAKIVINRHPQLNVSELGIYHFMHNHPEFFDRIEEGVYSAR